VEEVSPKLASNAETEKEMVLVRDWGGLSDVFTAEWVEGIPPERKTVLRSRPAPAPPFLPDVKGLDSCPIALATIAQSKPSEKTRQTFRKEIEKEKEKEKKYPIGRVPTSRRATNLVARDLGDLPGAEVEGGRRRDGPAARSASRNRRSARSRGGGGRRGRRGRRAASHPGRGRDVRGREGLGHGRRDGVAG